MTKQVKTPEEIAKLLRTELEQKTSKHCLELKISREETTVFDSKFGGVPYLPEGFDYPCNLDNDNHKPLKLLAQLNFSQLPHLEGFPERGILQFYLPYEENDDVFGLDFDDPIAQKSFRVIYHENVIEDTSRLQTPPEFLELDHYYFPFSGCFKLTAKPADQMLTSSDYQFNQIIIELWNRYAEQPIQRFYDLDDDLIELLIGEEDQDLEYGGHLIGGYPSFTQTDPREYNEEFRRFDTLLLQIDTDGDGEDEIMWGDCGIANFFIPFENLKNKDFSEVLYNWDCC